MARDHGGDLGAAMERHGGDRAEWLDLSTGINPVPYPLPPVPGQAWARLPEAEDLARLTAAARVAWDVPDAAAILPAPGLSALIPLMPRLMPAGRVAIPGPTYNEHAAAFRAAGWEVVDRPGPATRAAVLVNPNNPDGRRWAPGELALIAEALPLLVVDESFVETEPARSMVPRAGGDGLVVLRSFGKFHGLAGLRLGFAVTGEGMAARLAEMLGPWAVSGPAIEIGARALADRDWARETTARIKTDLQRLVALGEGAGWRLVGEGGLFATFETPDAAAAREHLAARRIWSRIFPYSDRWLRLGLPGDEAGWARLAAALAA